MTQTARKGKLYQLQFLIDLILFHHNTHACVWLPHPLRFNKTHILRQQLHSPFGDFAKRMAPLELTDLPGRLPSPKSPHQINYSSSRKRQRLLHRVACGRDQRCHGDYRLWLHAGGWRIFHHPYYCHLPTGFAACHHHTSLRWWQWRRR